MGVQPGVETVFVFGLVERDRIDPLSGEGPGLENGRYLAEMASGSTVVSIRLFSLSGLFCPYWNSQTAEGLTQWRGQRCGVLGIRSPRGQLI